MHRRLGEILVDAGVIDAQQLRVALAEAARRGQRVGEVLVTRGLATERAIVDALSSQLDVPMAPLSTTTFIPEHVLGTVPPHFARERQVLPFFLDRRAGSLEVAVSNPSDYELLDELRFRTSLVIKPLVALAGELADAIEEFYFRRAPSDEEAYERQTPIPITGRGPGPYLEVPQVVDDSRPGEDALMFQHSPGAAPPVAIEPPKPRTDAVQVRVERGAPRQSAAPQPAAPPSVQAQPPSIPPFSAPPPSMPPGAVPPPEPTSTPPVTWPEESPTLEAPVLGHHDATGPEVDVLRLRVAALEARVSELYGVLREAAAAHQTLLVTLAEKGLVERESFHAAVRARLDRKK